MIHVTFAHRDKDQVGRGNIETMARACMWETKVIYMDRREPLYPERWLKIGLESGGTRATEFEETYTLSPGLIPSLTDLG